LGSGLQAALTLVWIFNCSPLCSRHVFKGSKADITFAAINYRLTSQDVLYIFMHSEVDAIIVDEEYIDLLDAFRKKNPHAAVIVDSDGDVPGPFDEVVRIGWEFDSQNGSKGWDGLDVQPESEHNLIALAYTSGTTARPKGVEFLHRGAYLASLANASEYGLAGPKDTCRFLWTLPMFHAMGLLSVTPLTLPT
jgi:acyl-CoA synthetase (AMP-forming)/AMP-acid ligase II